MKLYTVRFAHLDKKSHLKIGDRVKAGDIIGIMGNSGASSAAHLHLDCVEGRHAGIDDPYRMNQLFGPEKELRPALDQAEWFVDKKLFGTEIHVTTYPHDPAYYKKWGWHHVGFDLVPADRHTSPGAHSKIHWNRSHDGEVIFSGCDSLGVDKGYGWLLSIVFIAK